MILLYFLHSIVGINLCSTSILDHMLLCNIRFVDCFSYGLFSIYYCSLLELFSLYIHSNILPCLNLEVGMGDYLGYSVFGYFFGSNELRMNFSYAFACFSLHLFYSFPITFLAASRILSMFYVTPNNQLFPRILFLLFRNQSKLFFYIETPPHLYFHKEHQNLFLKIRIKFLVLMDCKYLTGHKGQD
jgi:hypothetical protein